MERAPGTRACWRAGRWAVLAGGCLPSPALYKPCPCSAGTQACWRPPPWPSDRKGWLQAQVSEPKLPRRPRVSRRLCPPAVESPEQRGALPSSSGGVGGGLCPRPSSSCVSRASTGQPKAQAWTGLSSPAVGFLVCKVSAGKRIFQVGLSLETTGHSKSRETTFIRKMSWAGLGGSVLLEGVGCVDSESRVLRSRECVCVSGGHFGCSSPRVTRSHPVWWPHILSVLQAR